MQMTKPCVRHETNGQVICLINERHRSVMRQRREHRGRSITFLPHIYPRDLRTVGVGMSRLPDASAWEPEVLVAWQVRIVMRAVARAPLLAKAAEEGHLDGNANPDDDDDEYDPARDVHIRMLAYPN